MARPRTGGVDQCPRFTFVHHAGLLVAHAHHLLEQLCAAETRGHLHFGAEVLRAADDRARQGLIIGAPVLIPEHGLQVLAVAALAVAVVSFVGSERSRQPGQSG